MLCDWSAIFHQVGQCDAYRCLDSEWFVWVSQSNHIPMDIEEDKDRPWLSLQVRYQSVLWEDASACDSSYV